MNDASSLRNYFILRSAKLLHNKLPWQLNKEELTGLAQAVTREEQLVARSLNSSEVTQVHVDDTSLHQSIQSFLNSLTPFDDVDELLSKAGLSKNSLMTSIEVELKTAMVLEKVTAEAIPTDLEVYQWYEAHPEKFIAPERREAFQILITVNDLYSDNLRDVARQRMDVVAFKVNSFPASFSELALKHSECPSAVEGGRLGMMPRGFLYPELEHELFALESGETGNVVETPLGFHLLRCGAIEISRRLAWDEVKESLTQRLIKHKQKRFLQQWILNRKV